VSETPADWVLLEAAKRSAMSGDADHLQRYHSYTGHGSFRALCDMIAKYEQEPVDPLLLEARKLVSENSRQAGHGPWADECLAGEHDTSRSVVVVLAALRRGMELAKERQP